MVHALHSQVFSVESLSKLYSEPYVHGLGTAQTHLLVQVVKTSCQEYRGQALTMVRKYKETKASYSSIKLNMH